MTLIEYEVSTRKGDDMSELTNPDELRKNVPGKGNMKKTNTLYHHSTSKQVRKLERGIRTIPRMENKRSTGGVKTVKSLFLLAI